MRERLTLTVAIVALGLVLAEALVLVQLLKQQGRLLLRIEALEGHSGAPVVEAPAPGLPRGASAPSFAVRTLDDREVALESLWSGGKPVLLLFTRPNCEPCTQLLPDIGRWEHALSESLTIALIAEGSVEDNRANAGEHGISRVLLQRGGEVADAYRADVTPSALLVRHDGIIGSALSRGPEEIRSLVAGFPTIAAPAPRFRLPDLDGNVVDLLDLRGSKMLLVFWNPACGFCQKMLDDLKAWENDPPPGAPKLLIVSTGDIDANRAQGFRSTVVLEQDFATGKAFGVPGTPSAVLIDAQGKLASDVGIGVSGVFGLAGVRGHLQALALA